MKRFGSMVVQRARISLLLVAVATVPAAVAAPVAAQQRVEYDVAYPNPGTHEAHVMATFYHVPAGPLEVRMSRTSPGRYAVHDFAKNVYGVSATDGAGHALTVMRPDPYGWTVTGHDGTVRFGYIVFGDRVDGTFLAVDQTHAHMNMPATFVWALGFEASPIRLRIHPRAGWRIATQLLPTADTTVFTAPNLQYFMDSPTEVGPFTVRVLERKANGETGRYRLAIHHLGTEAQVDSFAALVARVIDVEQAIWGGPPERAIDHYTFIVDYLPWASGDGMEHRNSTIVTSSGTLSDSAARVARLGTMAHELFHQWNVERLRPATLEPFDFENANMSDALWFAEGFTQYYGPLAIRRAGVYTNDDYARALAGAIVTTIQSPARTYHSAAGMSRLATFRDAATSIDPTNFRNTFLSYYTWGAAIAAGLDLTLRTRFDRTLDEWMRVLWRDYGRHQTDALAPARPYTVDDLRASLGAFVGDTTWANEYFRRYIRGSEVVDYARLLAHAGYLLEADSLQPYLGASLDDDSAGVRVNWSAVDGSLWPAGINNGDLILAIDGVPVRSDDALLAEVEDKRVGEVVELVVAGRAGRSMVSVPLVGRAPLRLVTYEAAGLPITPDIRRFREAWLERR